MGAQACGVQELGGYRVPGPMGCRSWGVRGYLGPLERGSAVCQGLEEPVERAPMGYRGAAQGGGSWGAQGGLEELLPLSTALGHLFLLPRRNPGLGSFPCPLVVNTRESQAL